tara:strand:+ start:1478 stop:2401 length:924 start_codon:yes stop_codon:yes gene_type:complete
MFVFKNIDKSGTTKNKSVVHYTQNLNTGSSGLTSTQFISASFNDNYWRSLNVLFYTSGSPVLSSDSKYQYTTSNLSIYNNTNPQHLNKFHGYGSGSIISIPQQHYGERIKTKTFTLTDKSYTDNAGNNPIIKDDGHGNLYSSNSTISQSSVTSISSSDNYVGNIFYDMGMATITETGSWSGSVNYTDITSASNYTVQFDSTETVQTAEYLVTINPDEFDYSMNYSLRCLPTTSTTTFEQATASFSSPILSNPYLCSEFTGSEWHPYITNIALYNRGNYTDPVITARLPRPIMKSDKLATTFKIKLDL